MKKQPDDNKRNLLYFEAPSMRKLHKEMDEWQEENRKRLLSITINKDGENYCCIALTNPTEVVICDSGPSHLGSSMARVNSNGQLLVVQHQANLSS